MTIEGIVERFADGSADPPCMFANEAGLTAVMAVRQLRDLLEDSGKPVRFAAYAYLQVLFAGDDLDIKTSLGEFEANPENADLVAAFRSRPRPQL
jgi:hypothetical protein